MIVALNDGKQQAGTSTMNGNAPVPLTPPRIVANRRQIDNRFPVLGFTINTANAPYFEVLLTTDRSLFAPENASKRNASNFYASRQDSGLIHATESQAIYLVPPAVLRGFAQAQPAASSIFYTLVTYQSADGNGSNFAIVPEQLPDQAPSVAIAKGFNGHTLSSVLGISMDKLRRVTDSITTSALASALPIDRGQAMSDIDAETDRAEGEDGYMTLATSPVEREIPSSRARDIPMQAASFSANNGYTNNGYSQPDTHDRDFTYDDGYGEIDALDRDSHASYTGSTSPALEDETAYQEGQSMPAPLESYEDRFDNYEEDDFPYRDQQTRSQSASIPVHSNYTQDTSLATPNDLEEDQDYDDEEEEENAGDYYDPENTREQRSYEREHEDRARPYYRDEAEEFDGSALGMGYTSLDAPSPSANVSSPPAKPLSIEDRIHIIQRIGLFESSAAGYAAINDDGEFKGRFPGHAAHNSYHIGLSYGIIQFTQDSGMLGRLLTMMKQRAPDAFAQTFGAAANELLRITNAVGPTSDKVPGGRSARVQPVDGKDLWEESWLSRFREAGKNAAFQAAQNQLASEGYIEPMLLFAKWLKLDTDRALTMAIDRAVQMGVGGAHHWIITTVGPLQTPAQRQQALAALKYADLASFQKATDGLTKDGQWGPMTHAALVNALRSLGSASPVQIPTREQMMDEMVRKAKGTGWAKRVKQVHDGAVFTKAQYPNIAYNDSPYQL